MTHVPHLRLTMQGTLPNEEMFSCNLSLRRENSTTTQFLDFIAAQFSPPNSILVNNFNDMAADCIAFWSRDASGISPNAVLKLVKLAPIGADGHYLGPALEYSTTTPGGSQAMGSGAVNFPHQVARKVTLETDGDLGRVKGGFYLPGVTSQGFDATTDLTAAQYVGYVRDSVQTLINDLNNAPGLDATGSQTVVVASQGRTRNGVQVVPPTLWEVKRVNVGRRVDVQRRRANKISEARISDAAVS